MSKQQKYIEFLQNKMCLPKEEGIIEDFEISDFLKPHQKDIVKWAVRGGRRALFESFGLGKTIQQLEICRIIISKHSGKALIVCPLGVKQEFYKDALKFYGLKLPSSV